MFQRLEGVRVLQMREAELYRQLKHTFYDVPDLLERIRWTIIGNILSAFNVNGYHEYHCEPIGEAIMFKITEYDGLVPQQELQEEAEEDYVVPL